MSPPNAEKLNVGFWPVPRMWDGESVFVIGGGPSLKELDLSPIHKRKVIGVNQAFELGQWVDICYFGDERWYRYNKDALSKFGGIIVTSATNGYLRQIPRLKVLMRDSRNGIWSNTQNKICWNLNSGASAINLAVLLGAKKIILVAFDMKVKEETTEGNGGHNWHNKHSRFHRPKPSIYEDRFHKGFKFIRRDLDALGIECINANPDSAIDDFPKMTFQEAVKWSE